MENADIIITGNKNVVLSKEIFIPAAIVNVNHNQGKVWLANGKSEAQIISRNTSIGSLFEYYGSDIFKKTTSTSTEERREIHFFSIVSPDLTSEKHEKLLGLLRQFLTIFNSQRKGSADGVQIKPRIETADQPPISQRA
ncbi:hypothetical protein LAZ67_8001257 [Cordylochernes scorpioides]|uniref:Uncharacterized protein n=1 Tax=Cordylochernes scorpioides TaxID=51811 RepID=A0ABY6KQU4_9ARAC|nr:hypothetical protein LAZ67_8001257 [Cordylochernes scorpioides]